MGGASPAVAGRLSFVLRQQVPLAWGMFQHQVCGPASVKTVVRIFAKPKVTFSLAPSPPVAWPVTETSSSL